MSKTLIYFSTFLILFACNNAEQSKETLVATDSTEATSENVEQNNNLRMSESNQTPTDDEALFLAFYSAFVKAVQNKNIDALDGFVDENFGTYFIERNGAIPSFNKQYSISSFKSKQGKFFFELNFKSIELIPAFEVLPKIICDATPYNKQGCFADKSADFVESEIWAYTDLNEKEKQAISFWAKTIVYTVVNTNNYTYYFSKTDTGWKISFIDLRVPCEA